MHEWSPFISTVCKLIDRISIRRRKGKFTELVLIKGSQRFSCYSQDILDDDSVRVKKTANAAFYCMWRKMILMSTEAVITAGPYEFLDFSLKN